MTIGQELDAALSGLDQRITVLEGGSIGGGGTVAFFGFTGFKHLKIACRPGANNYEVSFDGCILKNATGDLIQHGATTFTVDPATSGVNGLDAGTLTSSGNEWYEIHVISDGTAPKGLFVKAGLTPVLPSGYTYSAFAGYGQVFTVSPLDLSQSLQYDNVVVMQDRGALPSTGVAASAMGTPQTLNIADYVPPKARFVSGFMGGRSGYRMQMAVMTYDYNQGIASDVGRRNAHGPIWSPSAGFDAFGMTENFENLAIENQTLYWKAGDTQVANILYLTGYKL
jgi:hypothetical protein